MLLLLFAGLESETPVDAPFHPVGGGVSRAEPRRKKTRGGTSAYDAAAFANDRDMRDIQDVMAALFAFEGIF
jgi:hypothetical protein